MKVILLVLAITVSSSFHLAFAGIPPNNFCLNNPDPTLCGFTTNPFSAVLDVFDQLMPGFGMLILWGPIVFGLWYKTQKPEIAGFAGIIIVATVEGLHPTAVSIALLLLAASLGIALIQIFIRVKQTQ